MIEELSKNTVLEPQHERIGSLVPRTPGERPSPDEVPQDLTKHLLALKKKYKETNSTDWLFAKQMMIKARRYYENKQNGYVNPNLEWQEYETRPGEQYFQNNKFTGHVNSALMELSRGNTQLTFSHIAPDSRRGEKVAKVATARYNAHKKRLFSTIKMTQENLNLLLSGLAARYTFFAREKREGEKIPVVTEKEYSEEGPMVCEMCYSPMKGESCASCGHDKGKTLESKGKAKVVEGYDFVGEGRCNYVTPDPLGLNFAMSAVTLKDSPYLIWDQIVYTDVLQSKYPELKIKPGLQSKELKYEYAAETSTPSANIADTETDSDAVAEFTQVWLDYELYCHKTLKYDVVLRDGTVLKAGTKLGDAFPDGLYMALNQDTILDLWNEDKNEHWTICPYMARIGTMIGMGVSTAIDSQDTLNELRNYEMSSAFHDAFRRVFVNPTVIDPDNLPADPSEIAVTNEIPDGKSIVGYGVDVLPGSQLSSEVYKIEEMVEQAIQHQLGTFSTGGAGAPDMKAIQDTATGLEIYRDITVGHFAPMLEMRANALDKEQAMQLLKLDQANLSPKQWERIKGDYGADAVAAFLEADLEEELIIEVAYESYMPQSTSQKMRKATAYLEIVGLLAQMGISPDSEYGAQIANLYGQPQELVRFDKEYDKAYGAVQTFKEVSDMIVQEFGDVPTADFRTDPVTAELANIVIQESGYQIDMEMDNHLAMIESFKDWWVKDEGRMAANLHRAAVAMAVEMHKNAMQAIQQEVMAEEQAMMQQQQAQQMAIEDGQRQMDREDAMMAGLAEMAEGDAQREHEAMMQDKELAAEEPPVVGM